MTSGPAASWGGSNPLVGVLGGMGPAATADFYGKLIRATPATNDQEHVRVVIWADPTVPDRSAALLGGGPDPTPLIEQGARALAAAGAELIAIPCNTAHAFLPRIEESIGVPLVHMIEETARYVLRLTPPTDQVGLLATTGTVQAGLFQNWLLRFGTNVVLPNATEQEEVMRAIRAIKSGDSGTRVRARVVDVVEALAARGAQAVITGCTEIPLVLGRADVQIPIVDPALVLAEAVIARVRSGGHPLRGTRLAAILENDDRTDPAAAHLHCQEVQG
jgi:aspartate racemase